ncbi:sulfate adenylyltransferase, large subunit [Pseudomonas sp. GM78]|uniref:sulfate adenylyltransferase subunit CysN n=1 Tax=Pseudomonas sp. GM78 TaxID=1144337 RepID=UPI000270A266|nr:sulfate adenylyltransferase subunit CysN [Pseudomonas sp. GM78]EJN24562.1 sulfate adenylyltransferase, large subunit [Pseudomonas sp. GM78]
MARRNSRKQTTFVHPQPVAGPTTQQAFLAQQQNQDLLRFITCGSVDDGKSTLIGRLLWESQQIFDDPMAALETESKKYGTQGDEIDFALLVDGQSAEREQGITIDVAYRFFSSPRRKFIVADTPGHEQYSCNMVTGASTAEVAVLLVDAKKGLLTQTRRHAYLAYLMGIQHVVLAVNKMDLLDFDAAIFNRIREAFEKFANPLGFVTISAIPLSALNGDNITHRSARTPWYSGPPLMAYLETIVVSQAKNSAPVFPVQCANRPDSDFRGFSGTVAQGRLQVGDDLRVTASGQSARVIEIVTLDGSPSEALAGTPVTLRLDKEIDISRGDVLSLATSPLESTDQFEATLVWMSDEFGHTGRSYQIKLATQWATASITTLKHRIDVNTLAHEAIKHLQLNDICVCNIATTKPLVFDNYKNSKILGGFILVDRHSHATVAAGMIHHSLRRSQNVHRQALSITRTERETLNGHRGKVIWFTGLSGSGKSTIANALELQLHSQGRRTYILDGDNVRQGLNKDLGFTDADRIENIRRIAEVAKLMMDAGLIVMTSFISPFRQERETARQLIGTENFVEVYVNTPLDVCEQRDPKGLYKKARNGQIPNMTGINSPYEAPENPDFVFREHVSVQEMVNELLLLIR